MQNFTENRKIFQRFKNVAKKNILDFVTFTGVQSVSGIILYKSRSLLLLSVIGLVPIDFFVFFCILC